MPRGRPPLRIGQHGKIARTDLGGGIWLARCRFRDDDGVVRLVERRSPVNNRDQYGKLAEDALLEVVESRRTPTEDQVDVGTLISALCRTYLQRIEEDGRATATMDTYRFAVSKLNNKIGGVRVGEATPGRIDAALRAMSRSHGATMARQAKTVLRGALGLAVLSGALDVNPVQGVSRIKSSAPPAGAKALTGNELSALLTSIRGSKFCMDNDLVDPITMLIATGLRRSELLGLRWVDIDEATSTATVAGKVVRVKGGGLVRVPVAKSASGLRTIPLPMFALDVLKRRAAEAHPSNDGVIFPSTSGTLRDPNNFGKQWRKARDDLGAADVTTHSFRKSVATLIDADGLSARVGADHLGHRHVSMTQDKYFGRGKIHSEVADLLDKAVGINDE